MASNNSLNWTAPVFPPIIYPPPPLIVYPSDSYTNTSTQSYSVYGYFVAILIIIFIALLIKIAMNQKRFQARNALRHTRARQNEISTVSRSADANIVNVNQRPSTSRRGSDETLKIDLPPTYEEVMKNFLSAKAAAVTPTPTMTSSPSVPVETRATHGTVEVEIETIPTSQQRNL